MEEQFLHIIRNKITGKERATFFAELQHDAEKKKAFMAFEKLWVANNMVHRETSSAEKLKSFKAFWKTIHPEKRIRLWQSIAATAAALLVALLASSILIPGLWQPAPETMVFSAPKGNISQVTLADGSNIWLNSSSKATITTYGTKKVEVDLEGEAYFDVPHNETREFWVQTGHYRLLDLGTRFNVKYNPEDHLLSTALFEGAIEFSTHNKVILDGLKPGTMFSLDLSTKKLSLAKADADFITAWKQGKFVFVNKTLEQIAKELEEWYDVKFVFADDKVKKELFSGVIKRRTSLEHILKVLKISANLSYTIQDLEDGSCIVNFN
ncbi:FecR family protein [Saccharicrinis carchari]|uniref:FecR family protein n=1 Tax=Saccharicrinis carchari TaxID=1168039 RepID=A0A521ACD7_SACCC|nr:FecR family protein [Saccharicrinis carchari]SMO32503.1 FecR family protein [Saccharicrinis carchari]